MNRPLLWLLTPYGKLLHRNKICIQILINHSSEDASLITQKHFVNANESETQLLIRLYDVKHCGRRNRNRQK